MEKKASQATITKPAKKKSRKPAGRPDTKSELAAPVRYTARELLAMPPQARDAILEQQAKEAAKEYRDHPKLMEFTIALGGDDFLDY